MLGFTVYVKAWFPVSGFRFPVSGFRFSVSGFRFRVFGFRRSGLQAAILGRRVLIAAWRPLLRNDESTNRRIDESTNQRNDEMTKRRIDESTNRRKRRPGGRLFCYSNPSAKMPVRVVVWSLLLAGLGSGGSAGAVMVALLVTVSSGPPSVSSAWMMNSA